MSKLSSETHILRIRFVNNTNKNLTSEVEIYFPKELKNFSHEFEGYIDEFNSEGNASSQGTMIELPDEYMRDVVSEILYTAQCNILKVLKETKEEYKKKSRSGGGKGDSGLTSYSYSYSATRR